jgi:porphobilinogen deaminase
VTGCTVLSLPEGAVVGTASLRRQAALKRLRPDLEITVLRGNVDTRIDKVRSGQVDAAILATIGLQRVGLQKHITKFFTPEEMLPACGQGTIAIETQIEDKAIRSLFDKIHHHETGLCTVAERAALQALDGSCQTPVGSYAILNDDELYLRCAVYEEDGSEVYADEVREKITTTDEAQAIGYALGQKIKPRAPEKLFA